jgi:hypothetical protein
LGSIGGWISDSFQHGFISMFVIDQPHTQHLQSEEVAATYRSASPENIELNPAGHKAPIRSHH